MVLEEAAIPPAHLLAMIERLPEGSMTVSMRHDKTNWRDFLGADLGYYAAAGIYNAVNNNTRATGNWAKGKAPKIDPWPVPSLAITLRERAKSKRPTSVADLHARAMAIYGPGKG